MKRILVFPCGSEIALEIYRSLKYSIHFELIGASSIDDHGKFVYKDYVGNLPFVTSASFIEAISEVVKEKKIDAIFPAMDLVLDVLKKNEQSIGCKVIGSCYETVQICTSKSKTYSFLKDVVKTPKIYTDGHVASYPVFMKPDIGYGARGTKLITNYEMLQEYKKEHPDCICCEYLCGDEYTLDCFTDRKGQMLFSAPRLRRRIMNGISVNTIPIIDRKNEFHDIAKKINNKLRFRGAWFIQLKRDKNGDLTLLEIAARLGGSSSLYRNKGVNFALLTLFDAFGYDVEVFYNNYEIELDRALDDIYKINILYDEVFVDFDDCVLLKGKYINIELVAFLYQCINENKKITLLTRHKAEIYQSLSKCRLKGVFDRVIHITDGTNKSQYIDNLSSIFIDDSYSERLDVMKHLKIPVFSPDMIKSLLK